jgi:hypothetical protein
MKQARLREEGAEEMQTLFIAASASLLQELGYSPKAEFTRVRGAGDVLLNGYDIPATAVEEVRQQLSQQGISFVQSEPLSLAQWVEEGMEFVGKEGDPALALTLRELEQRVGRFLDSAGTATARATFYNTREEQEAAVERLQQDLFELDRGLFAALLALPGTTDYTRQMGLFCLLSHPRREGEEALLSSEEESRLLRWLARRLPPPRMLKLFEKLKARRINNARTRKLILHSILSHKRLELWSTRYRRKLRSALTHALGVRLSSIVRDILAKPEAEQKAKERSLLQKKVLAYANDRPAAVVEECLRFLFGREEELTLPLLKAYHEAKEDLSAGRVLSYETLEGLRSTYHKEHESAEVLELTKKQLTQGQQMVMQRKAEEAGVEVAFDPRRYDAVRLYLYAFERGCDEEMVRALAQKAREAAQACPIRLGHTGILLDASASMAGNETQALRPLAVALAMRDWLQAASEQTKMVTCGGDLVAEASGNLVRPRGETSLAEGLVALLKEEPETIFLLSDGYENAPAGRVAEVLRRVRALGITTPVYQFSPVMAAESRGVRSLAEGLPALPVASPQAMALPLLRAMLSLQPQQALVGMLRLVGQETSLELTSSPLVALLQQKERPLLSSALTPGKEEDQ